MTSSADGYVRVAFREADNLQVLAARVARISLAGGPEFFGQALKHRLLAKEIGAAPND